MHTLQAYAQGSVRPEDQRRAGPVSRRCLDVRLSLLLLTFTSLTTLSTSSSIVTPVMPFPAVRRISGRAGLAVRDCHLVSPGMLPGGMVPISATAAHVHDVGGVKATSDHVLWTLGALRAAELSVGSWVGCGRRTHLLLQSIASTLL